MVFVLMWLLWVITAISLLLGTIWLGILCGAFALILTICVLVKYQENLYLREELKKNLVNVRNDVINLYQKYQLIRETHFDIDGKDRETTDKITKNIGQNLSWLWPESNSLFPTGVLAIPTTDQESVKELNSLFQELREGIKEYNEKMLELRKKEKSIVWYFVYSSEGYEYLNKIALIKAAEKMISESKDDF